jgi:hypothetical protein
MALYAAWTSLCSELDSLAPHLRDFSITKPTIGSASDFTLHEECLLEGLLSRIWQAWCKFCRTSVLESCMGTIDGSGAVIAALPMATSEAHVSGAAIKAKGSPAPSYWGSVNTTLRYEPTWGDVDVLAKIIPRMGPANQTQLLAAFSSAHAAAKALQLIRNAAAHDNVETRADLQTLWTKFTVFPITHPSQCLYWIEPNTKDYLGLYAIEELRDAGMAAIS